MNILPPNDITKARLPCRKTGCGGFLAHHTIGTALAIAEYHGKKRSDPSVKSECIKCDMESTYSFDMILEMLPFDRRPQKLGQNLRYAIALAFVGRPPNSPGDYFIGERALVETGNEFGHVANWGGLLRSKINMAPSLPMNSIVGGEIMNGHAVIFGCLENGTQKSLPFVELKPGTLDTGLFLIRDKPQQEILPANLFCSNPSCCHIFGPYYSQFKTMIAAQKEVLWLLGCDSAVVSFSCELCGMSRIVDDASFEGLLKI